MKRSVSPIVGLLGTAQDDEIDQLSDSELSYDFIVSKIPLGGLRGVLCSQLRAQMINHAELAESLDNMRKTCAYRFLSCSLAGIESEFIMKTEEYLQDLDSWESDSMKSITAAKFRHWVKRSSKISVFREDLLTGNVNDKAAGDQCIESVDCSFTASEIDALLRVGYFINRRDSPVQPSLWFSHPKLGALLTAVKDSRVKVPAFIKLRRFHEITTKELCEKAGQPLHTALCGDVASKKRRKGEDVIVAHGSSCCAASLRCTLRQGIHFHLADLEGISSITRMRTPCGELIRLSKK